MSREEFRKWITKLTANQRTAVSYCLAEGVYGDDFNDEEGMSKLRQHVYDIFPEWHLT